MPSDSEPLFVAVGERIRHLREQAGLSQAAFGEAAGMNEDYVWRIEAGRQNLSLRSISRISVALGMSMAALLEGIEADPAITIKRPYRRGS